MSNSASSYPGRRKKWFDLVGGNLGNESYTWFHSVSAQLSAPLATFGLWPGGGFTIKLNHQLSSPLPFFKLHMLFIFFLNTKKGLSSPQIENAKLKWETRWADKALIRKALGLGCTLLLEVCQEADDPFQHPSRAPLNPVQPHLPDLYSPPPLLSPPHLWTVGTDGPVSPFSSAHPLVSFVLKQIWKVSFIE